MYNLEVQYIETAPYTWTGRVVEYPYIVAVGWPTLEDCKTAIRYLIKEEFNYLPWEIITETIQ